MPSSSPVRAPALRHAARRCLQYSTLSQCALDSDCAMASSCFTDACTAAGDPCCGRAPAMCNSAGLNSTVSGRRRSGSPAGGQARACLLPSQTHTLLRTPTPLQMLLRGACAWGTSNLTGQSGCTFSAFNCSAANLTVDAQALCAVSGLVNASTLYSPDFNSTICTQGGRAPKSCAERAHAAAAPGLAWPAGNCYCQSGAAGITRCCWLLT